MSHTPTPWEALQIKEGIVHIHRADRTPNQVPIAVIDYSRDGHTFTREELPMLVGREIVAAVNNHQKLVDALVEAKKVFDRQSRAIGGNDKLSGCEEFYRGYNAVVHQENAAAWRVLAIIDPILSEIKKEAGL